MINSSCKQIKSRKTKIAGFSQVQVLLALAIFGVIAVLIMRSFMYETNLSESKTLANQTNAYSKIFAKYISQNMLTIKSQVSLDENMIVTPQMLIDNEYWDTKISTSNLFGQIPCLSIIIGPAGQIEATMFYVNNSQDKHIDSKIINRALQNIAIGGIYNNGVVIGGAGWTIANNSLFYKNIDQCNGTIAESSLVINLDLMRELNTSLNQVSILKQSPDLQNKSKTSLANQNVAKTNLYIKDNAGISLGTADNPNKLSISNSGQSSSSPMLSFSNTSFSFKVDTIQPNIQLEAGTACNADELGKTALNYMNNPTDEKFAKDVLICSKNSALCTKTGYCYLSSSANIITFQNNGGIQNDEGEFLCPMNTPFLDKTSIGSATATYEIRSYKEDVSWSEGSKQFNVSCVGSNCIILGRKDPNMPFITTPITFPVTIDFITGNINQYIVARGFTSRVDSTAIDYNGYLSSIGGKCTFKAFGSYFEPLDGITYYYRICKSIVGFLKITQIIAIPEIDASHANNIPSASCSSSSEYQANY